MKTIQDWCNALGRSRQTIDALRKSGKIPKHDLMLDRKPVWFDETFLDHFRGNVRDATQTAIAELQQSALHLAKQERDHKAATTAPVATAYLPAARFGGKQ